MRCRCSGRATPVLGLAKAAIIETGLPRSSLMGESRTTERIGRFAQEAPAYYTTTWLLLVVGRSAPSLLVCATFASLFHGGLVVHGPTDAAEDLQPLQRSIPAGLAKPN